MRQSDEWREVREKLRKEVRTRGWAAVAADVPCGKSTLFRLLKGETQVPSLPTIECIERMLDDQDLRADTAKRWR